MEKGKQVAILDEDPKKLRVCFNKDTLQPYIDALLLGSPQEDQQVFEYDFIGRDTNFSYLGTVLQLVEKPPSHIDVSLPMLKQIYDDLALLQAFLRDPPRPFVGYGRLMAEIRYLAMEVVCSGGYGREMVIRLGFILKAMSHWMDVIRMIYGKPPKASPAVPYSCFEDDLADPVYTLVDYLEQSPKILSRMEKLVEYILLLRAILMDPPDRFREDDASLRKLEFVAREVNITISSVDLNHMDDVNHLLIYRLFRIFKKLISLEEELAEIYAKRPKPSRRYYPKTAQLDFVDLLVDNLGELLQKAKADPSIRFIKFHMLLLRQALQRMSFQVKEIPEPLKEQADVKDVITSIAVLAYEAEYVIDSSLLGGINPTWYSILWLRDILTQLEHQGGLMNIQFGDGESIAVSIHMSQTQVIPILHTDNPGFGDTLFRKVFGFMNDGGYVCTRTSLVSSYEKRKKEVFLDLLENATIPEDLKSDTVEYTSDMSQAELKESLHNLLRDKYHLIVLEGVQDMYALNDIKKILPDNPGHKSRILLTTPSLDLVFQCRYGFNLMSRHHPSISQIDKPTIENDLVGFVEEKKRILEQLIGGPKKLLIISIVGIAGQGKTTLAQKLFGDPLVIDYFDTRACCCISQVYETKQLLLEILGQIIQLSNSDHQKDDAELAEMLYKHLKGRRFLIFLDDIWEIDAWNYLRKCFTNENNGSRIIFTTRIQGLVYQAKSDSIMQSLSLLSDDESWALLKKKLFQKESCPPELLDIGRKIANNCKGLPLSLVLIAGLLLKMEKKVYHWERIAKSLSSLILDDMKAQGKGIIELSYNHLPGCLKSCFLYFGAFLEDKEIPISKLKRLWIAEGFVKHTELKSLEDVAEVYFTDLIGRSLVTIAQEKSNGGVKSCRVHDLLREFCLNKAKEENFLQKIDEYDQDMDPCYSSSSIVNECHVRRLCIYSNRNDFTMLKPSGQFIRSLLFFATSDMGQSYSYNTSYIYHHFKFLKTLNLEGINIGDSFKEIGALTLLRYLACQSHVDLIPSSIANLWNLQTFHFKQLVAKVVKVSYSIWDMSKLRHVHINDSASFELDPDRLENSSILENLQTFSTPSLAYGDGMERLLRKLAGIRKLKCIFLDSWNEVANSNHFPDLEFLSQLVSVNVFYSGKRKYPCEFNFPTNLKKLTLSNFHMPWDECSQLAKLRELEVLKLLGNAFEGETWEMEDEVFPKLKYLKLDTLDVIEWNAPGNHFPCLERLILNKCEQLEEIPPSIGDCYLTND